MYTQTFKCIQPRYAQNRQKPAYIPVFPGYIPEGSLESVEHGKKPCPAWQEWPRLWA